MPCRERLGNRTLRLLCSDRSTVLMVEHVGPAMHGPHVHEESEQICSLLEVGDGAYPGRRDPYGQTGRYCGGASRSGSWHTGTGGCQGCCPGVL